MSIDLRNVEPLGSKSALLEQALKHQQNQRKAARGQSPYGGLDPKGGGEIDLKWLQEDKASLQNLVSQMDASIGQLAKQIRDVEKQTRAAKEKVNNEQKLLFKQIKTLNGLLKKQVDLFSAMNHQVQQSEIQQSSVLPMLGIGVVSGLIGAATVVATMPWISLITQKLLSSF